MENELKLHDYILLPPSGFFAFFLKLISGWNKLLFRLLIALGYLTHGYWLF